MAQCFSLLNALSVALGRKYHTRYTWRALLDQARWLFVPQDGSQPPWTVAMVDLLGTRGYVTEETLLSLLRPLACTVPPAPPPSCRQCGRTDLDHFYTSKRDQTTLCPACFADRESQHRAKTSPTEEIALSSLTV